MSFFSNLFIEMIQISLGQRENISKVLTEEDWKKVFSIAQKQAVVGFAFGALESLVGQGQKIPQTLLLEWIGLSEQIKQRNRQVNQRCKELGKLFADGGFRSCLLKGQGIALYYYNPLCRQCGDIDVWVEGDRSNVLSFIKSKRLEIGHVDIKHTDVKIFEDVPVEVHFIPTWFYNPFTNKKLQRWFKEQNEAQFSHSTEIGINTPTTAFNLVYVLIHIYRHLFDEGIGLRQLVDYYYILRHSTKKEREEAMKVLSSLRMKRFTGATMYAIQEVFNIDDNYLLRVPLKIEGQFLLREIMRAGNFGHYDDRNRHHHSRWANGIQNVKRNMRFVCRYPQEVCWMPVWKIWHWCWRKRRGYL